jgi:hypothetical protein
LRAENQYKNTEGAKSQYGARECACLRQANGDGMGKCEPRQWDGADSLGMPPSAKLALRLAPVLNHKLQNESWLPIIINLFYTEMRGVLLASEYFFVTLGPRLLIKLCHPLDASDALVASRGLRRRFVFRRARRSRCSNLKRQRQTSSRLRSITF